MAGIINNIGQWLLQREAKNAKRKKKGSNLRIANRVGVLFQAEDESNYKVVRQYVRFLKEEGIKNVMVLGFIDGKENPFFLPSKLEFDYFNRKDLNLFRIPQGTVVRNFIEVEYDILIDLTEGTQLPLTYILALSRARLKVGRHLDAHEPYLDLMIQSDPSKGLEPFLPELNRYLNIFNSNNKHVEHV